MTEEQIKYMVNRFLGWYLPVDFQPDAGISYNPIHNYPGPVGTNLLTYAQAEVMIRYITRGISDD